MTDPVPYEPAENIPPILLLSDPLFSPTPLKMVDVVVDPADPEATPDITFTLRIREYNLDDTLSIRVIVYNKDNVGDNGWFRFPEETVAPDGNRDREYTFRLDPQTGPLLGRDCAKVVVAVSDSRAPPFGPPPPWWRAPQDGDGNPLTVIALAEWWVWLHPPDPVSVPGVNTCGEFTY